MQSCHAIAATVGLLSRLSLIVAAGGEGEGACAPGRTVQGRHLEGRKYGILKSGHFWRIGVHIAERIRREVCIT